MWMRRSQPCASCSSAGLGPVSPEYTSEPASTAVPPCEEQPGEIHEVIVVQMREECVRDFGCPPSGLEQTMMAAGSVVENDDIVGDFQDVAGAHALQRRRRVSGPEQRD